MKCYQTLIIAILISLVTSVYGKSDITTEAKQYGNQLLDSYQNQPRQEYDFLQSNPDAENIVYQSQQAFKRNQKLESQLSQIKSSDNEAVVYTKKIKKPAVNHADFSDLLSPKPEKVDSSIFYTSEENIESYSPAEMGEAITYFSTMKAISDPMKDGLGGVGQSENPTVMQGKCQRCTVTLGSAFKDCCDLHGIAKGVLGGCRQEEKELANSAVKDKRCVLIQSKYCTKKKLGVCIEKKSAYCCYGSEMAKTIQEIAHQQLGLSWGEGKNPNCGSLTSEQLSNLNFNTPYAKNKLSVFVSHQQFQGTVNANKIQINTSELQKKLSMQYRKPIPGVKK